MQQKVDILVGKPLYVGFADALDEAMRGLTGKSLASYVSRMKLIHDTNSWTAKSWLNRVHHRIRLWQGWPPQWWHYELECYFWELETPDTLFRLLRSRPDILAIGYPLGAQHPRWLWTDELPAAIDFWLVETRTEMNEKTFIELINSQISPLAVVNFVKLYSPTAPSTDRFGTVGDWLGTTYHWGYVLGLGDAAVNKSLSRLLEAHPDVVKVDYSYGLTMLDTSIGV